MPEKIPSPTTIESAGNLPKRIEEYVGRVNTNEASVSIARMRSPQGWEEPRQTPDFDEYTLVLDGLVVVEHEGGRTEVRAGEDLPRFGQQSASGGGQLDMATVAHEEGCAETRLQRLDLLGQGRPGDLQAGGGAAEVELLGDGDEIAKLAQLHPWTIWGLGGCL